MIEFNPSDQVIIYQRFDHSDVWTWIVVGTKFIQESKVVSNLLMYWNERQTVSLASLMTDLI